MAIRPVATAGVEHPLPLLSSNGVRSREQKGWKVKRRRCPVLHARCICRPVSIDSKSTCLPIVLFLRLLPSLANRDTGRPYLAQRERRLPGYFVLRCRAEGIPRGTQKPENVFSTIPPGSYLRGWWRNEREVPSAREGEWGTAVEVELSLTKGWYSHHMVVGCLKGGWGGHLTAVTDFRIWNSLFWERELSSFTKRLPGNNHIIPET